MIELINIHKSFGALDVLKGVSFWSEEFGVTTVLGPNGSGKTTLIKILLGMVIPDDGEVRFNESTINGKWHYRNQLDYLPQIAKFPDNLKVSELIKMIKKFRDKTTREQELIEMFDLKPHLEKKLGTLSGGTRQKVNIILAFMFDSPVIILDEPTSGLDPVSMVRLKELIRGEKKKGKLILITTHILSFVEEMSDQIVFLLEGNIYFKGSIEDLKISTKQENLELSIASILEEQDA
ncbi:MAG: ABC transporter ATP-binding protein [Balneolaceae bacterium]|nr:ABC transporter ATP-binding protein [Balneolaceae bacterium]MBO6547090.1 ABC transporter ATP-binding protein [Balneolaceae bacterium]MBO6647963.1 ABC transporter ATP-binding protein [Balneolaceae bacterium]